MYQLTISSFVVTIFWILSFCFFQVNQHQRDIDVLKTETLRLETEIEKLEMTKSQIENEKKEADIQTNKYELPLNSLLKWS